MKPEIEEFLKDALAEDCFETTLENMKEMLFESDLVYRESSESHRWWEEYLEVVQIKNRYFGYIRAHANRDESVRELGWDFDWSTVQEYEPKEIKTTIYVVKEN